MFDFRIIICTNELEIIDRTKHTSYDILTPREMVRYIETEIQLSILDGMRLE